MSLLQVENVTKRFGDKTAVHGITFEAERGEIYGLLGANGAGKTTTMRMVLGLIMPDEGKIRYDGRPYDDRVLGRTGYLPEERGLYPKVRVSDQLVYLAGLKGMGRREAERELKRWLEEFGAEEYADKKIEELSKGNQQKIQFIAAVLHRPDILILDEAFSGLDPVNVEILKRTVKRLRDDGCCIVFSTHRMEHVEELCRRMTILHRSHTVLSGNIREIKDAYPKERIRLKTDRPVAGLERVAGVTRVAELGDGGVELRIAEAEASARVLEAAIGQAGILKFELLEPSMNEIFIKAVGGDGHE